MYVVIVHLNKTEWFIAIIRKKHSYNLESLWKISMFSLRKTEFVFAKQYFLFYFLLYQDLYNL